MADHLKTPRMSALLDDPGSDPGAVEHLDECAACRGEFENLRRTRMALSAMSDLAPPADQWEAIEAELEDLGLVGSRGASDGADGGTHAGDGSADAGARGSGETRGRDLDFGGPFAIRTAWARAAAAVLVFTGGMLIGHHVAGPSSTGADADRSAISNRLPNDQAGELATAGAMGEELDYEQWLRRLENLRAAGPTPEEAVERPEEAAEHLARLDALIQGARDYVHEMPADARVNDFLFEVVEERRALNDVLQMASLEYR